MAVILTFWKKDAKEDDVSMLSAEGAEEEEITFENM